MQVFVPKVSGLIEYQGRRVHLVKGRTTIEEGHPILNGREELVEPLKIQFPAPKPPRKLEPTVRKSEE